ncbi:hypothetical protein B0H13DRAFT_1888041 [Mycena leptocephala]|nr:hypothetical protein B0H13DRAFT_1888041 [Mycena leptocephala]
MTDTGRHHPVHNFLMEAYSITTQPQFIIDSLPNAEFSAVATFLANPGVTFFIAFARLSILGFTGCHFFVILVPGGYLLCEVLGITAIPPLRSGIEECDRGLAAFSLKKQQRNESAPKPGRSRILSSPMANQGIYIFGIVALTRAGKNQEPSEHTETDIKRFQVCKSEGQPRVELDRARTQTGREQEAGCQNDPECQVFYTSSRHRGRNANAI